MTSKTLLQPSYLQKRYDYSCKTIESLRQAMCSPLAPLAGRAPLAVVSVGSYGRCEVSPVSDIDFFIVHDSSLPAERLDDILRQVGDLVRPISHPGESDEAKFGREALALYSDLSEHIGWKCEDNTALTRRMLMLLEGRPLFGHGAFARWQHDLLCRYVPDDHGSGLARFLLNDLIRYYRTLMANFEEKRAEGKAGGYATSNCNFRENCFLQAASWRLPRSMAFRRRRRSCAFNNCWPLPLCNAWQCSVIPTRIAWVCSKTTQSFSS